VLIQEVCFATLPHYNLRVYLDSTLLCLIRFVVGFIADTSGMLCKLNSSECKNYDYYANGYDERFPLDYPIGYPIDWNERHTMFVAVVLQYYEGVVKNIPTMSRPNKYPGADDDAIDAVVP
jgi:hypothetical protein